MPASWASNPRSRNVMRGNRWRDTLPELRVRSLLHRRGFRYRVNVRPEPGIARRADLVFPTERVAVMIDGCFWHGCPQHYVASKSNEKYWANKIAANRARDADTDTVLAARGWLVLRRWAHDDPEAVAQEVADAVLARRRAGYRRRAPGAAYTSGSCSR